MTGKIMPLRERDASTVQAAADAFLSSPRYANPNTRRGYTSVLDRLLTGLGADRPLAEVSGEELAGLLEQLWGRRPGDLEPQPRRRRRLAVLVRRQPAARPAPARQRRTAQRAPQRHPRGTPPGIDRALTRRDLPLREKTLWRMLYETAARASEVLALNIEDPGLDARRAPIRSKGGDTEWICWGSGTAHLLPRLIRGRQAGPVFLSNAAPAPPAAPQPRTCARPPDGPGSATTAPGSCSPGTPGGSCTSSALRGDPPRSDREGPAPADHGQDPAQPAHRHAIRQPRRRSRR